LNEVMKTLWYWVPLSIRTIEAKDAASRYAIRLSMPGHLTAMLTIRRECDGAADAADLA
jgi:hypothetical protein